MTLKFEDCHEGVLRPACRAKTQLMIDAYLEDRKTKQSECFTTEKKCHSLPLMWRRSTSYPVCGGFLRAGNELPRPPFGGGGQIIIHSALPVSFQDKHPLLLRDPPGHRSTSMTLKKKAIEVPSARFRILAQESYYGFPPRRMGCSGQVDGMYVGKKERCWIPDKHCDEGRTQEQNISSGPRRYVVSSGTPRPEPHPSANTNPSQGNSQ